MSHFSVTMDTHQTNTERYYGPGREFVSGDGNGNLKMTKEPGANFTEAELFQGSLSLSQIPVALRVKEMSTSI